MSAIRGTQDAGTWQLVQFNLAMAVEPLDHPRMATFVSEIAAVNAHARQCAGFVWMPEEGEAGDAVAIFGSNRALANISLWASVEELWRFAYEGPHGQALRRRREWFEPSPGPAYVLWWTPARVRPGFREGKRRLEHLAANGPTAYAFTFGSPFAPGFAPGRQSAE